MSGLKIITAPRMDPLRWERASDDEMRAQKPSWGYYVLVRAFDESWALFDQTCSGYTCVGVGPLDALQRHADDASTHKPLVLITSI